MGDGNIGYDYGALFDGISKMNNCNKAIEGLIEKLSKETGTALDNWQGAAANHYNDKSKELEKTFGEMNQIVFQLANTLHIRAGDMQQQDVRSGNRFNR
jgi:WXG100 family type VII secretion target